MQSGVNVISGTAFATILLVGMKGSIVAKEDAAFVA
jgi:hypothetical protein